ncbi:MAG: 30S ribosomal protein S20 [Nitrospiraceae bacterium]|nr:MAG: 30S ribosomal protein S20 [Nitrospiraceae bacterium]
MPVQAAPKKNKSALKRVRQTETRTLKNKSVKSLLKTLAKAVEKEVTNKSAEGAKAALVKAVSAVDKAARKGIIHKNTAARRVAQLTRLVNSMSPSEAA